MLAHIQGWIGTGSINIFGPPFAGKDTQCKLLAVALDASVVAGGDLLRGHPDMKDHERAIMDAGELLPIEVYLRLVVPILGQQKYRGMPLVYSSVGRFKGEEGAVQKASKDAKHPMRAVVLLEVPLEVALRHHLEGDVQERGSRADDDPEVIPRRFREFDTKTRPVIDFYRNDGKLVAVDGDGTKDEVFERIITALYDFARLHPRSS